MGSFRRHIALIAVAVLVVIAALPSGVIAQSTDSESGGFAIQVTPSPLVFTAQPGTATTVELKIRNSGDKAEHLKIEPRSFRMNQYSGEIQLLDAAPAEVTQWLQFDQPTFTVQPGAWYTERVTFSPPASAGFSYSFVLNISRAQDTEAKAGERKLQGSVAVFSLVNIDRPGATKKLEIATFSASKNVYEYLPVKLTVTLHNSGNTILQPYGNIFIQRSSKDDEPIATLPFNEKEGYILPGTSRTIDVVWKDGFPVYETKESNGKQQNKLAWNWSKVGNARIGKYTARLVAVYNDGKHDVPLQGEVQFWVLPWKFILAGIVIFIVFAFGLWSMIGKLVLGIRHKAAKRLAKIGKKSKSAEPAQKNDES